MEWTIIAMDGQGNVDFRDGQTYSTEAVAKRIADDMNKVAGEDHDWFYMVSTTFN